MKFFVLLVLFISIQSQLISKPAQITNSTECYSCVNRDYSKICYSTYSSSTLYCCDESDTSLNWGGGTGGFWNEDDDLSDFPEDSEYTMCPNDNAWGNIYYYVSTNNGMTVTTDYVPQGGVWWFRSVILVWDI